MGNQFFETLERRQLLSAPSFLDTTAVPGVTYYYWSVSCYSGSAWLIKGFTPVARPA